MAEKKKQQVTQPGQASDKKRALDTALAQIEKDFGKGAVMRLGENAHVVVEAIPTGSLALDMALGIGGVPKGRIIEIYGPESSAGTSHCVRSSEAGGRGGLYRRRARFGPHLCQGVGGGYRFHAHLPAGYRRAGAGDL